MYRYLKSRWKGVLIELYDTFYFIDDEVARELIQEIGLTHPSHTDNGIGLVGDFWQPVFPFDQGRYIHAYSIGKSLLNDASHYSALSINLLFEIFILIHKAY